MIEAKCDTCGEEHQIMVNANGTHINFHKCKVGEIDHRCQKWQMGSVGEFVYKCTVCHKLYGFGITKGKTDLQKRDRPNREWVRE